MARNTIGQFIAALRKANGMTQQDVADRLGVSNKAVSRWERDECAPDLSVIPALAEMFGVTCDELLRGERKPPAGAEPERREQKAEKQIRRLISGTLSGFRTLIWISLGVTLVGLVCMLGISYGFYRPVIGFAVMLLFAVCALVLAVLAVNRTKEVKTDNELFDQADPSQKAAFDRTLGRYSYGAFFAILSAVLMSLPLICFSTGYVDSVLSARDYFSMLPGVFLVLAVAGILTAEPYMAWITGRERPRQEKGLPAEKKMTLMQWGLTVLAAAVFIIAPWFDGNSGPGAQRYSAIVTAGMVILLGSVLCFVIFLIRRKEIRRSLVLPGIRNVLMAPAALIAAETHTVYWVNEYPVDWYTGKNEVMKHMWNPWALVCALGFGALVYVVFWIIGRLIKRKRAGETVER